MFEELHKIEHNISLTMPPQETQTFAVSANHIDDDVDKIINVGVIGCGRIGLLHLEALSKAPGIRPVICSNPTIDRARKAAEKFNVKEYCADAMGVVTHPAVQAVWICSPSQFPDPQRFL